MNFWKHQFLMKIYNKDLIWLKKGLNVRFRLIPSSYGMVVFRLFLNEKMKNLKVFEGFIPNFHNNEFLYREFRSI